MYGSASKIERSGQILLGIINDVLDLSKIEAGRVDVQLQNVDLVAVLYDVYNAVEPLARQNGNRLSLDCPEEVRLAYADLPKLRQSLLNLVNNACKFTRDGQVSVAVRRLRDGPGDWTEVRVVDNGIGIRSEDMGKLFQPFSQVDNSTTRKYGGTGLGLAISKKFCQMMGGDITVESAPGRGSCFPCGCRRRATLSWRGARDGNKEAAGSTPLRATEPREVSHLGLHRPPHDHPPASIRSRAFKQYAVTKLLMPTALPNLSRGLRTEAAHLGGTSRSAFRLTAHRARPVSPWRCALSRTA